jgi:hypothetical protein
MTAKRTIPRSQAIYPYGVGAILDWGQECFVVLDTRGEGGARPKSLCHGSRTGWALQTASAFRQSFETVHLRSSSKCSAFRPGCFARDAGGCGNGGAKRKFKRRVVFQSARHAAAEPY